MYVHAYQCGFKSYQKTLRKGTFVSVNAQHVKRFDRTVHFWEAVVYLAFTDNELQAVLWFWYLCCIAIEWKKKVNCHPFICILCICSMCFNKSSGQQWDFVIVFFLSFLTFSQPRRQMKYSMHVNNKVENFKFNQSNLALTSCSTLCTSCHNLHELGVL